MTAPARRGVEGLLADARRRLDRLSPREAFAVQQGGAVLVDIRPYANRYLEGAVPGALIVERNVLGWRFDPIGEARLGLAAHDLHVVVFCNEGYTSSLAAGTLQDLGLTRATDLIGGYRAWRGAGLPVVDSPASGGEPHVCHG
ncbi:MAG: rhodanese-like domain-containing protein [Frankiaceae bacterium]